MLLPVKMPLPVPPVKMLSLVLPVRMPWPVKMPLLILPVKMPLPAEMPLLILPVKMPSPVKMPLHNFKWTQELKQVGVVFG